MSQSNLPEIKHKTVGRPSKSMTIYRGGRAFRRIEEDTVGADYVALVTKLGPRTNESILAFQMRIASLQAGREFVLSSAKKANYDIATIAGLLGIDRHNLQAHFRTLGLSSDMVYGSKANRS